MPRVFVAVRVPPSLCREIETAQVALRREIHDVKWVEPGNLHLTLRFFGDVDAGELERIESVVTRVAEESTAFPVELAGVGTFPPRGRPRVIWVGMRSGAEQLVALAGRLDAAFGEAGLGCEDRPFRPHLTIGRLRGPDRRRHQGRSRPLPPAQPLQAVPAIHAALEGVEFGPLTMPVEGVAVVESVLRPQGPLYRDTRFVVMADGRSRGNGPLSDT